MTTEQYNALLKAKHTTGVYFDTGVLLSARDKKGEGRGWWEEIKENRYWKQWDGRMWVIRYLIAADVESGSVCEAEKERNTLNL